MQRACDALEMPRVSSNDLRRSVARWFRKEQIPLPLIAEFFGHEDTRMLEKVQYAGRTRPAVDGVSFGLLVPCLLAYCVVRTLPQRLAFGLAIVLAGVGASALSAALSYGPDHAWAWLDLPVQVGLVLGALLALALLPLRRRGAAALALLALSVHLGLLNQAPADPYFAQTLQAWEQGRFIRFHGVVQWLGWLWPYAAMGYVLVRLSRTERKAAGEK